MYLINKSQISWIRLKFSFKNLANVLGLEKLRTNPYKPKNKLNSSLLLHTLPERSSWKNHLSKVIYGYNYNRYSSSSYLPYYLMFGRKRRLPMDLILWTEEDSSPRFNYKEYLESWKKGIETVLKGIRMLGTGCCRSITKTWQWSELLHQNNLTVWKSSKLYWNMLISINYTFITNSRWHATCLPMKWK